MIFFCSLPPIFCMGCRLIFYFCRKTGKSVVVKSTINFPIFFQCYHTYKTINSTRFFSSFPLFLLWTAYNTWNDKDCRIRCFDQTYMYRVWFHTISILFHWIAFWHQQIILKSDFSRRKQNHTWSASVTLIGPMSTATLWFFSKSLPPFSVAMGCGISPGT